jgi:hypothetical protein
MRQINKFDKYVLITRFDGNFPVNRIGKNSDIQEKFYS